MQNVEENVLLAICSVGVSLAKYSAGKKLNFSVTPFCLPRTGEKSVSKHDY